MPSHLNSEAQHRREICAAGRALRELGFLPGAAGNLSVRLGDGRILATPSGAAKGELAPGDLILLRADGTILLGRARGSRGNERRGAPSSEIQMHLRIYSLRPDVRAVCHAHPPAATGFAVAGRALDRAVLGETAILLGAVPLAPFAAPGTADLGESIVPCAARANAVLLANHGVVSFGESLRTALQRMEMVEHCARVTLVAELAGGAKLLTRAQVSALVVSRPRFGLAPMPADAFSWIAAEDERGKW